MAQSAAHSYALAVLTSTAALGAALLLRPMPDAGTLLFVVIILVSGWCGGLKSAPAATLT